MSELTGKRVLVVEDEALIASMIVEWLAELGCEAIGPASRVADGFVLVRDGSLDAAVLDVNVNSERVFPLAEYLRGRGVPVVFATGYGERIPDVVLNAPILEKPFTLGQLDRALTSAFQSGSGR